MLCVLVAKGALAAGACWVSQERLAGSIVVIIAMTLLIGMESQLSTHSRVGSDKKLTPP